MNEHVWAVVSGEYEEFSVDGVFSSEARADAYARVFGGDVREWDLDPFQAEVKRGVAVYEVKLDEDGEPAFCEPQGFPTDCEYFYGPEAPDTRWWGHVNAKSREHAYKIARAKRRILLANPGLLDAFDAPPTPSEKHPLSSPKG